MSSKSGPDVTEARIRPLTPDDRAWVARFNASHWGSDLMAVHGALYRLSELQGFCAIDDDAPAGLVTYQIDEGGCEIVSLDSLRERQGIGSALLQAVEGTARERGCRRLWLITTNDNLPALGFYQRRGFVLAALHRNAVAAVRQIKPEIPVIGIDGIPIRDEIELEKPIDEA